MHAMFLHILLTTLTLSAFALLQVVLLGRGFSLPDRALFGLDD